MVRALAGDAVVRASLAAGGAALLALALPGSRRGVWGEPWLRAAAASAVLFASVLAGASRADGLVAPHALLSHPAVVSAPRVVVSSQTIRSYVRGSTRRPNPDVLFRAYWDMPRVLERHRSLVGIVSRYKLDRLAEPARVEEIATGHLYGREVVVIRAAPPPPRSS